MQRSADVLAEAASFRELMLPAHVLSAVRALGFERPSPVQQAAIPLARLGADVIVQAKAGTGKTLVFSVAAVERVQLADGVPQVLVLAPTREIALQASEVVSAVGAGLPAPGLAVGTFIGGLPIEEDEFCLRRTCHVAVGTPGRLLALAQRGALPTSRLRMLVLDEADKLLDRGSFGEDVAALLARLPERKQVLALSATYSEGALAELRGMMRRPQEVLLCSESVSLLGIKQLFQLVAPSPQPELAGEPEWRRLFEARVAALLGILGSISFHQAMVFCNWRRDAEELAERLQARGFPAAYLSAAKGQLERIDALNALRDFRLRVAVTTDLAARGVDLDRVNLVVNLDLPLDAATYAHRVGRAGRFGTRGVALTLVTRQEQRALGEYLLQTGAEAQPLPVHIPLDWYAHHQQEEDGQPGTSGGSSDAAAAVAATANRHHGTPAAAAVNGGLKAAFSDVSTASLWYDEPSEDLPSSPTWPPAEPRAPLAAAASSAQAAPAQGAAQWAAAAAAAADAASPLRPAVAQQGLAEAEAEEDGINLSYTVVPPAAARNMSLARLSAPQRQGGGAPLLAAPVAPSGLATAAAAAQQRAASSESESDSWASTSDDEVSSSEESEAAAAAVPSLAARRRGQPGRAGGARASSAPSAIPQPRSHSHSHHHHHSGAARQQQNGSLSSYANGVRSGGGMGAAAADSGSTSGGSGGRSLSAASGPLGEGQPRMPAQEELGVERGQGRLDVDEEEEEEQEWSFRDSWLRGALDGEERRQRAAPPAGGLELRPRGSSSQREAAAAAVAAPATASTAGEPASAAAAAGAAAAPGAGGSHYWLLAASAQADILSLAGEAGEDEAARLLEDAFSLDVAAAQRSIPEGLAAAAASAAAAGPVQPGSSSDEEEDGQQPASLAILAAAQQTKQQPQLPPARPLEQGPRQQEGSNSVSGGPKERVRRPLGSAQADATRQRAQRAAQRGEPEAQQAQHGRSSGGGTWGAGDSLAAEAALLEAWAEEDSAEEEAEEEGGWQQAAGSYEEGPAAAAEAGAGAEEGNVEAWRQYWEQHYQQYGCYPTHFGPQPSSQPAWPTAAAAAPVPTVAAAHGLGHAGPGGLPAPLPPPPPPPLHPMLLPAPAVAAAAAPADPVVAGGSQAGEPAPWGPWIPDSEGYVRVPAEVLRRYQEAEWRDWQRRYGEWCWVWDQYYSAHAGGQRGPGGA